MMINGRIHKEHTRVLDILSASAKLYGKSKGYQKHRIYEHHKIEFFNAAGDEVEVIQPSDLGRMGDFIEQVLTAGTENNDKIDLLISKLERQIELYKKLKSLSCDESDRKLLKRKGIV
jgi:hypothetical protein